MNFSQGGESNHNGRWLEFNVEYHFKARGVPVVDFVADRENADMFYPAKLVRRVPYKSIFGCHSTSEFVFYNRSMATRIECRVQETPGSVDEKLPYLFLNARDRMPEPEVILLLHGDGARADAVAWLKRQCRDVSTKMIRVQSLSDFNLWLKTILKEERVTL